ncbi:MAG: hypothetical protein ABUL62_34705 [Myxococcales bacterium]
MFELLDGLDETGAEAEKQAEQPSPSRHSAIGRLVIQYYYSCELARALASMSTSRFSTFERKRALVMAALAGQVRAN